MNQHARRAARSRSRTATSTFVAVLLALAARTTPLHAQAEHPFGEPLFVRGDADVDRVVTLSDGIVILDALFLAGGPLRCADAADSDDDGRVTLGDAIALFELLFRGGAAPPLPFAHCGFDPSFDDLSCFESPCPAPRSFTNSLGLELTWIPPGSYRRGARFGERGNQSNEYPRHVVVLTRGFYAGVTEITQRQFRRVMGFDPSTYQPPRFPENVELPVDRVFWDDAVEFCERLSDWERLDYRLPTEAEWEYMCRAGTETRFWFGDALECLEGYCDHGDQCSFMRYETSCEDTVLSSVGTSGEPNPWGLFDIHGNAAEWCFDGYGPYPTDEPELVDPTGPENRYRKIVRGNGVRNLFMGRSASRAGWDPHRLPESPNKLGFRVVVPAPDGLPADPLDDDDPADRAGDYEPTRP